MDTIAVKPQLLFYIKDVEQVIGKPRITLRRWCQISQNALVALDAKDSLQSMLASQILSIHVHVVLLQSKASSVVVFMEDLRERWSKG